MILTHNGELVLIDAYNQRTRGGSTWGTITTECGGTRQRGSYLIVEMGCVGMLSDENTEIKILEPQLLGGFGEKKSNGGTQWYQQDGVYDSAGIAMAHCANIPGGSYNYWDGVQIRKLTPTECFRLMGFTDEDVQKCRAVGMSDTQLYKQAGNSIVVDVLMSIFQCLL